jgi:hypothetical protein
MRLLGSVYSLMHIIHYCRHVFIKLRNYYRNEISLNLQ